MGFPVATLLTKAKEKQQEITVVEDLIAGDSSFRK